MISAIISAIRRAGQLWPALWYQFFPRIHSRTTAGNGLRSVWISCLIRRDIDVTVRISGHKARHHELAGLSEGRHASEAADARDDGQEDHGPDEGVQQIHNGVAIAVCAFCGILLYADENCVRIAAEKIRSTEAGFYDGCVSVRE